MKVRVWDAPVRLFHWTLAALVLVSFITGQVGGSWLTWHMRSGYAILALLLFRLAWGVMGSETARFTSFVRGPRAGLEYLRATLGGRHPRVLGHNPLGGWMVLAMLFIVAAQAASGLFVDDEIATQGPLAAKVSNAVVSKMGALHHYNQWLVVGAVALHVVAIATYYWGLKVNLVRPMVSGEAEVVAAVAQPRMRSPLAAAILLAIAAAAVYWLVIVYPAAK